MELIDIVLSPYKVGGGERERVNVSLHKALNLKGVKFYWQNSSREKFKILVL